MVVFVFLDKVVSKSCMDSPNSPVTNLKGMVTLSSSSDMIAVLVSGEILGGGCYLFLMQEEEYEKCHRREAQAQAAAPPVVGANRSKSQLEMDLSRSLGIIRAEPPSLRASELPSFRQSVPLNY